MDGPPPTLAVLLEVDQRLEIYCHNPLCRHEAVMAPAEAVARLGADTSFEAAGRRLVCTKCGEHGRDGRIHCRGSITDYYAYLRRRGGANLKG